MFRTLALALATVSVALFADTIEPLKTSKDNVIHLADYAGKKTFFELMAIEEDGIKAKMDNAWSVEVPMASAKEVIATKEKFTSKVYSSFLRQFKGNTRERVADMTELVDELQGTGRSPKKQSPASLKEILEPRYKAWWGVLGFLTLANGSFVTVHLNDNTYFYNAAYEDGDVLSGRSYAAGPSHPADDASYPFYLSNLRAYMADREDLAPFYTAIMQILTESNPAGLDKLPTETETAIVDEAEVGIDGQTLVSDFMAIYTAENYRHIISDLRAHDWENALAEVTFISAFSEKAGIIQNTEGEIVDGTPSNWRYKGPQGSGIGGPAGKNRRLFQKKVCNIARERESEAVAALDAFTGGAEDCLNGVMKVLNNYETQNKVRKNAKKLTKAMVQFLGEIRADSKEIAEQIQ